MQVKKLGHFPFGKHSGLFITEVAATDPKYLHWLQKYLRTLICKALDIDEALLPQAPPTPSALR